MKKIACLFLCFLILCCCSCKEEEISQKPNTNVPQNPPEEFVPEMSEDSFYTYDGDIHNTHITLALVTSDLTAPIQSLTFDMKNDSDYSIVFTDEISSGYIWEKWENGKWNSFNKYTGSQELIRNEMIARYETLSPHTAVTRTESFATFLDVGTYRLRKNYKLTNEKGGFISKDTPGIACVAEIYFSVLPAPQS